MYTEEELYENRQQVLTALRSDKYKQGYSSLRQGDCFCLLGLICEVSKRGLWVEGPDTIYVDKQLYCYQIGDQAFYATIPDLVLEWLGIEYHASQFLAMCMQMNDSKRYKFNDMAKILELGQFSYVGCRLHYSGV